MKYQFSPTHHISLDCLSDIKEHPLRSILNNDYLINYQQVSATGIVNDHYHRSSRLSLTHVLMFPYAGISVINRLFYEGKKGGLAENHSVQGVVDVSQKIAVPFSDMLSVMSSVEYRLLALPVNVRANVNYRTGFSPVYITGTLYETRLSSFISSLRFSSHYKSGFNGIVTWNLSQSHYDGLPLSRKLTVQDLTGSLTWKEKKIYLAAELRYRDHLMNERVKDWFYGFEMRYDLSKNVGFKIIGTDVTHLRDRRQTVGRIETYYVASNQIWYMPGSILFGVSFKY
ncbi:MAG: hypothetical protein IJ636_01710 [Bacteroidales bacterium]|nr:hypothetical protein [Bacteroidales bacterium]